MRRMEAAMQEAVLTGLQRLRRDLFRDLDGIAVSLAVQRLDDERVTTPFRDRIVAAVQAVALAGAAFGQEQVERFVFGTVKASGPLAIDWELANNDAAEWALRYGYELVRGLLNTTRQRLVVEIDRFIRNSETLPQLVKRLEPLFGPVRAEMVAVTEVTRAYAEGNAAAWRASGVIQKREWRTANDELVCPWCGPRNGRQYALDDRDGTPPAHPRCRCWSVPVVEIPGL
jgi:SPP1 gp7 family putative phage head morphogenesis protein